MHSSLFRGRYVTLTGVDDETDTPWVTRAFVPDPLPSDPQLSPDAWTAVVAAHEALARTAERAATGPDISQVVALIEAQSSLRLDAAPVHHAGPRAALVAATLGTTAPALARSVSAVTAAMQPPTTGESATARIELAARTATDGGGRARSGPGFVGRSGASAERAVHVPPPVGPDLDRAVAALKDWVDTGGMPRVVAAALTHLQLETVRPFQVANGQVARLALLVLLSQTGTAAPVAISEQLLAREDEYTQVLARARTGTGLDEPVTLVATAVRDAADATRRRLDRVDEAVTGLADSVRDLGLRGVAVTIVEHLATTPVMTVRQVAEQHDVTFQTANVAVGRLVEAGVLEQLTDGNYDRVFGSDDVLTAATT